MILSAKKNGANCIKFENLLQIIIFLDLGKANYPKKNYFKKR